MSLTEVGKYSPPLLRTKFFIPAQRAPRLERSRLFELLDVDCPLTLVSAPAGFGKTTLVSDWLDRRGLPVGWISLDPADSEPRRFLSYLAGAVRDTVPGADEELLALLRAPQLPPVETLLTPLINELSHRATRWVLVLDDYHVIDDPEVHAAVELLAHRLPPGVRLVLTTRVEPPFPLRRMRTQDLLQEIRAEDLRFNDAEIDAFLKGIMGLDVEASHASTLARRTEGWITGLQMAALSLRQRQQQGSSHGVHHQVSAFVDGFTENHRDIFDYLAEEVLAGLDTLTLDFLLSVAVTDRLHGSLSNALTGEADGQARLEALEAANLFVIPLDDHRVWYRFHHLFRSFLLGRLEKERSEDQRRELHRRACDWLTDKGLVDDALEHALQARDQERCLDLMEVHVGERLRQGDVGTAMRWFDAVPNDWTASRAGLVIDRALALLLVMRWREVAECLAVSRNLLVEMSESSVGLLAGRQAALESILLTTLAEPPEKVIRLAREALEQLADDDVLLRGSTAVNLGSALIRTDAYDEARRVLRAAAVWQQASGDRMTAVFAGQLEGQLEFILGRLHGALDCYRESRDRLIPGGGVDPFISLLLVGEAEVYLEWGDLGRARDLAEQAVELSREAFPIALALGLAILVSIHRSRRDLARAREVVGDLEQLLEAATLPAWRALSEAHRARIWCLEMECFDDSGAVERLGRWVNEHQLLAGDVESRLFPDKPREVGWTCALRWLLARGENERAGQEAAQLSEVAEARGWRRVQIEARLFEARARLPNVSRARAALRQALELASPEGYVQILADEGPWLVELMGSSSSTLLEGLPDVFRARTLSVLGLDSVTSSLDLELLSSREMEVLKAIAEGHSNAETGRRLFIAPSTVKKHLENIYGKLGVHNRVEAIARCRASGWL